MGVIYYAIDTLLTVAVWLFHSENKDHKKASDSGTDIERIRLQALDKWLRLKEIPHLVDDSSSDDEDDISCWLEDGANHKDRDTSPPLEVERPEDCSASKKGRKKVSSRQKERKMEKKKKKKKDKKEKEGGSFVGNLVRFPFRLLGNIVSSVCGLMITTIIITKAVALLPVQVLRFGAVSTARFVVATVTATVSTTNTIVWLPVKILRSMASKLARFVAVVFKERVEVNGKDEKQKTMQGF
jgi:hypothetical protein